MTTSGIARIAELNDSMRRNPAAEGKLLVTRGVLATGLAHAVVVAVARFNTFTKDNDPYGEHDFGKVVVDGVDYFWKIDYYDKSMEFGSEDPSDPTKTTRVLTIMLAEEY